MKWVNCIFLPGEFWFEELSDDSFEVLDRKLLLLDCAIDKASFEVGSLLLSTSVLVSNFTLLVVLDFRSFCVRATLLGWPSHNLASLKSRKSSIACAAASFGSSLVT